MTRSLQSCTNSSKHPSHRVGRGTKGKSRSIDQLAGSVSLQYIAIELVGAEVDVIGPTERAGFWIASNLPEEFQVVQRFEDSAVIHDPGPKIEHAGDVIGKREFEAKVTQVANSGHARIHDW